MFLLYFYNLLMPMRLTSSTIIPIALAGIFIIVAVESIFPNTSVPTVTVDDEEKDCAGTPIFVTYPYQGGMLDPWECKVQCDDKKQRYIVYTNNIATPCEEPPGCLDYGEDYGIKCRLPVNTTTESGAVQ